MVRRPARGRANTSRVRTRSMGIAGLLCALAGAVHSVSAPATPLADVGFEALRSRVPQLADGSGLALTQVEASTSPAEEPPVYFPIGSNAEIAHVTFTDRSGGAANGTSGHATGVAARLAGTTTSLTPGLAEIDVFEASDWLNRMLFNNGFAPRIPDTPLINHSWAGASKDAAQDAQLLMRADWLVADQGRTLVVGMRNNAPLLAEAHNVLAVHSTGVAPALTSTPLGPGYPGGRNLTHIVAPQTTTSAATATVSSALNLLAAEQNRLGRAPHPAVLGKAILMASARRAVENSDQSAITDYRATAATRAENGLDTRYGAGQLDILAAHAVSTAMPSAPDGATGSTVSSPMQAGAEPAAGAARTAPILGSGYAYVEAFGGAEGSPVEAHYTLTIPAPGARLSATLAFNARILDTESGVGFTPAPETGNLDLSLLRVEADQTAQALATSQATVSSTETVHFDTLPAGTYRLEVRTIANQGSAPMAYALAWYLMPAPEATALPLLGHPLLHLAALLGVGGVGGFAGLARNTSSRRPGRKSVQKRSQSSAIRRAGRSATRLHSHISLGLAIAVCVWIARPEPALAGPDGQAAEPAASGAASGSVSGAASESAPGLPAAFTRAMARLNVQSDQVSVVVLDEAGKPLMQHLGAIPRHPASTIKLVTTFAALEHFGPVHTFDTAIMVTGTRSADGVLDGDLYLKPGGDPFLTEERLWQLTRAVVEAGVREVRGDLVIDKDLYAVPEVDPGAFDGQPYRLYNVQPYPLLVNFKASQFTFNPRGNRVDIRSTPALPNLQIDNRLTVKQGRCNEYQAGIQMTRIGPNRVRFDGRVPAGCRDYTLSRTVLSHPDYIYGLFSTLYALNGGKLEGGVREGSAPDTAERLFEWPSLTLAEVLGAVNKYSNNPMTRMLMLNLGADMFGPPATPEKGARALAAHFGRHGINMQGTLIDNGSGLSRSTRISADTLAAILEHSLRSPYAAEFIASLPLPGLDGTLRRRMRASGTRGRAHLKTGRLDGVAALAGFLHPQGGGTRIIVFFLAHPDAHRGIGTDLGDLLVELALKPD